ncbi:MAG: hypothetical protein DCF16_07815 [Alphaproteobacteria bacterium]|nr:MAG: hypothetical protein DCF16_07815 [Alphaproteobacteria bacterium]
MRVVPAFLLLLVLAVSSHASAEGEVWQHPSGAYSIEYGRVGWSRSSPFGYDGRDATATFQSPRDAGGCVLFEIPVQRLAGATLQADANAVVTRYTADNWSSGLGYAPEAVRHFTNESKDGVQIATLVVDAEVEGHAFRSYYQAFVIITQAGGVFQEISCSLDLEPNEPNERDVRAIWEFFDALRFPGVGV